MKTMKIGLSCLCFVLSVLSVKAQWQNINKLGDLNTWSYQPGFIGYYNGAANTPGDGAYGSGIQMVLPEDTRFGAQIIIPTFQDQIYYRRNMFSAWDPWIKVWSSTNLNKSDVDFNCKDLFAQGNIGLGTMSPNARLDVNGVIQTYNKDNTGAYWDNLRLWSDGGSSHIESSGDESGLYLRSNGAGKIILSSNVGVGTDDTKGYKLAVAGNAIAESMTVKVYSQWPDYVLKSSYILPSLSKVQTFINKNGHLPDIPAADVLEKDGLNLGELVKLQMKKIEELTLYILQQQGAINGQAEQIRKIKKQLKRSQK